MSQNKSTKAMKSKNSVKAPAPATARKQKAKMVSKTSNSGTARNIGRTLGTAFGGPVLGKLAGDASSWLSKIMGFGAYKVNQNSLLTNNQIPSFSTKGDTTIISNREYIADVFSSVDFLNLSYLVNPGNSVLFPWLSKIAEHYEEYHFHGLIFEFKSTSGTSIASTNTAMGTVIMAADYDALDSQFTTKRQMENTQFCTTDAPYNSFLHPIECAPGSNLFNKTLVSSATSISGVSGDPRLYFPCTFQMATSGMQAASNVGELWVSYQVELSKPVLETNLTSIDTKVGKFAIFNGVVSGFTTQNQNLPLTVTAIATTNSNASLKIEFPDNIPRGSFLITISGGSGASSTPLIARSISTTYLDVIPQVVADGGSGGVISSLLTEQATAVLNAGQNDTIGFAHALQLQLLSRSTGTIPFVNVAISQLTGATLFYTFRIVRIAEIALGEFGLQSSSKQISSSYSSSSSKDESRFQPLLSVVDDNYSDLLEDFCDSDEALKRDGMSEELRARLADLQIRLDRLNDHHRL